jgi:thiamine biosynthesis lipoprotein
MTVDRRSFRAMGTDVHLVVVDAPDGAVDEAGALLAELEARWSRFLPDSELCRINDHAGLPVVVSESTFTVVQQAVEGWWATAGRYDPTVLPALVAAGYDRTFRRLGAPPDEQPEPQPSSSSGDVAASPGCADVQLLPELPAVLVPRGVALDLGGIGKGAAADRAVAALLAAGASGACANVGGDVRVAGTGPSGGGWVVGVHGPDGEQVAMLSLASGGVATSSPTARSWTARDGSLAHHLIDPTTGRPAQDGPAAVSVVAGSAADAEVLAKAVYLGPEDLEDLLAPSGAAGLVVHADGRRQTAGPWEELRA